MADHTVDMGDQGCGEMVMSLSQAMRHLAPGDRLTVLSHDLGAPADVPAWCRLTGHDLVSMGQRPASRTFEFVLQKR